jgi:hypothetical protein
MSQEVRRPPPPPPCSHSLILQCLLPPSWLQLWCLCQLLFQLLLVLHLFLLIDSLLPPIKSGSDYLQTWDLILFWLHSRGFSTGRLGSDLIITDTTISLASQYWEGQLWMAVQDLLPTSRMRSAFMISELVLRVISLIFLGQWSVSLQFFKPCSSYGALHPRHEAIIDMFASKQKDIYVATISSIISDAKFMDECALFGTNGKTCLVMDDPLDNAYPPDLSQVESI